ncbi:hypothetical protein H6P81_009111 [Aristolochia fimbriata]|uniref:Uncharacterized protein n=1 Tax=Aristolochia fimbriata TaxID=158543 RepID=A0AAV7EN45_ARIFI|nr:hypothetical protein H6P81_009111 [Aristolochia fimbriata]
MEWVRPLKSGLVVVALVRSTTRVVGFGRRLKGGIRITKSKTFQIIQRGKVKQIRGGAYIVARDNAVAVPPSVYSTKENMTPDLFNVFRYLNSGQGHPQGGNIRRRHGINVCADCRVAIEKARGVVRRVPPAVGYFVEVLAGSIRTARFARHLHHQLCDAILLKVGGRTTPKPPAYSIHWRQTAMEPTRRISVFLPSFFPFFSSSS